MDETTEEYRNRMRAKVWKPRKGLVLKHPGGKGTPSKHYDYEPLPDNVGIRPDGSRYEFKSRSGRELLPLEVDESLTEFTPQSYRKRYIRALFFGEEKWIKHFESMERGVPLYDLVGCRRTTRDGVLHLNDRCVDRNLKLRAELNDQILFNSENRRGFYEAYYKGESTSHFNKNLQKEVRDHIYFYLDWRNSNEKLGEVGNGKRQIQDDSRIGIDATSGSFGKATGVLETFRWSSLRSAE